MHYNTNYIYEHNVHFILLKNTVLLSISVIYTLLYVFLFCVESDSFDLRQFHIKTCYHLRFSDPQPQIYLHTNIICTSNFINEMK